MNIKPIRNERDYDAALAAIDLLMGAEPNTFRKVTTSRSSSLWSRRMRSLAGPWRPPTRCQRSST